MTNQQSMIHNSICMQVRSQLWEVVNPPPEVEMLVYMDGCDTLFGSSVEPFIAAAAARLEGVDEQGESLDAPKPSLLILPQDRPHSSSSTAEHNDHEDSGVVWVLHREQSKAFLAAWWQEAERAPGHSKYDLLVSSLHRMDPTCHTSKGSGHSRLAAGLQATEPAQATCREKHAPYLGHGLWLRKLQCKGMADCAAAVPAVFNFLPSSTCTR